MANDTRAVVLNLMSQKAKIEDEIKQLGVILAQNRVGMDDPLVDNEGFPLSHVDVYQVRHARQKIICLQNDYKAIMKQIENGLGEYYESNSNTPTTSEQNSDIHYENDEVLEIPFAKIMNVVEHSPSDEAGLQNEDMITQFGSVNNNNFKDVTTIATIVQHCQDTEIKIQIKRGTRTLNIKLRPHKWAGQGLLGCKILPIDHIDR